MSHTFRPAEYLIPADLKLSTIRRRSPVKEDQIERIRTIQHYWHHRMPDCKLLGVRDLKRLTVIDVPIIEFIHNAPPEVIYMEGFGYDRYAMQCFFLHHYDEEIIGQCEQFYLTEWYPKSREDERDRTEQ